ncbi:hypothetical protein [Hyphomicrobium sp.]|uniref:hypothetical protein n=1 Tax=Hyphomicrobium sp. TaxID=82 RepID=UPI001D3B9C0D|nr:hypothetical protein [Hyphomicrobium sp.]MBY0561516.1 hypothetical protein [Hyphomicrobium sp.]
MSERREEAPPYNTPITGWVIDPIKREIVPGTYRARNYQSIYPLISEARWPVDTFTIVELSHGDTLYVDDNGLLHRPMCPFFFLINGYRQPLIQKGLVLGTNSEGETIAPLVTREQLIAEVTFLEFLMPVNAALAFNYWKASDPDAEPRVVFLFDGNPDAAWELDENNVQRRAQDFPYRPTYGAA